MERSFLSPVARGESRSQHGYPRCEALNSGKPADLLSVSVLRSTEMSAPVTPAASGRARMRCVTESGGRGARLRSIHTGRSRGKRTSCRGEEVGKEMQKENDNPLPLQHFCSQRAGSGYPSMAHTSDVIGGAAFRWALRFCLCTITLLSASQHPWTPQQRETRKTLVCKPLIRNSEHLLADLTCRSGGAFSFSRREETLNHDWH